jgi:hypothetical protein
MCVSLARKLSHCYFGKEVAFAYANALPYWKEDVQPFPSLHVNKGSIICVHLSLYHVLLDIDTTISQIFIIFSWSLSHNPHCLTF